MRIAFVHPELGLGGAERLVVDAALAMQVAGHRVVIYTLSHSPEHCFAETRDGTLEVRVRGAFLPSHIGHHFRIPCMLLRMFYLSFVLARKRRNFDILVCDLVSHILPVMGWFTRLPMIFYGHFPDQLLTPKRHWLYQWYRLPIDRLEAWGLTKADRILVNSQFTASMYAKTFPHLHRAQPEVLYPSVRAISHDSCALTPPPNSEDLPELVLLAIHRFERHKNVRIAIDALALLRRQLTAAQFAQLHLIIAGGYQEHMQEHKRTLRALRDQTQSLQLGDQVTFILSCSDAERQWWLARCLCVVYTPIDEHFGLVPLEAMATRRPVVAVNRGGPVETIRHGVTGLLCEPTPSAFATAMAEFILNQEKAAKMGHAGYLDVLQRFSHAAFGAQLEAVLNEVVIRHQAESKAGL